MTEKSLASHTFQSHRDHTPNSLHILLPMSSWRPSKSGYIKDVLNTPAITKLYRDLQIKKSQHFLGQPLPSSWTSWSQQTSLVNYPSSLNSHFTTQKQQGNFTYFTVYPYQSIHLPSFSSLKCHLQDYLISLLNGTWVLSWIHLLIY